MKRFILSWLTLCSFLFAQEDEEQTESISLNEIEKKQKDDHDYYYPARVSVGPFFLHQNKGSSRSKNSFFGEADIFIPLFQSPQTIFFASVRGLDYEGKPVEGNFGLGVRHIFDSFDWMMGLYAFYDRNRTRENNFYNQVTFGVELKTDKFTFDANGYIPFGKIQQRASAFDKTALIDGVAPFKNILFKTGYEVALWGLDGEVGYEVFEGLSFYGGGFYFHRDKVDTVAGPFARMNWTYDFDYNYPLIFDQFHFELGGSYDSVREWRFYTGIKFSWLLGTRADQLPRGIAKRMYEYVRRDYDIISTGNNDAPMQLLEKSPGNPVNVNIVTDFAQFTTALTNGADVIALQGTASAGASGSILAAGQTLTGKNYVFGDNISIQLSTGGTFDDGIIQVSSNNTIRDMTMTKAQILSSAAPLGTISLINNQISSEVTSVLVFFDVSDPAPVHFYIKNNTFTFHGNNCFSIEGSTPFDVTVEEFIGNTFNLTASPAQQTGVLFNNLAIANDTTGTFTIEQFTDNVFNMVAGIDNSLAVDFANTAGSGVTGVIQNYNITTFERNMMTMSGANGLRGVNFTNNTDDPGTNVTQNINITSFSSNTVQIGNSDSNKGFDFQNLQKNATSLGKQLININQLTANQVIIGQGTGNRGIDFGNTTLNASVTPQIVIGTSTSGGFYNNQITLGSSSTQSIVFDNSATTGTINVNINNFGQNLSTSNFDVNVTETGSNVSGISITP